MRLLKGAADLETIARSAIAADSLTVGRVEVHEGAYETLCNRLRACDGMADNYYRWTDAKTSDLVQLILTLVISVAVDPVLDPGDNHGFALVAAKALADRNGFILDIEACDFFLRLLLGETTELLDGSVLADLRALISDHLYSKSEEVRSKAVRLAGRGPVRSTSRTAFIAPPLTGLVGEELAELSSLCDEIEDELRALGFDDVLQPIRYSNPEQFPVSSRDSELVRRSDIDNILRSDLVVALLLRRATGLGSVLAWAERGGAPQLLILDDETCGSPLPRSSTGVLRECMLRGAPLRQSVHELVLDEAAAIDAHVAQRLDRLAIQGSDFKQFRDVFVRLGRSAVESALPAWFTIERVIEMLRTIDHFAVATDEEYGVLRRVLGLDALEERTTGEALSSRDVAEAERFAESIGLTRAEYSELLEAAATEIEAAGFAIDHRRRTRAWWSDLWRKHR